jgi:predicted RND superfamily exporter protein
MKKLVERVVDLAGRRPCEVLLAALLVLAASWSYASRLELRSDFLELLPRDSPGFKAFEHQLGRTGGGATLLVIVESPDRKANERFVDDLSVKLGELAARRSDLVSYVETGTKEVRAFFDDHRALYADLADLEAVDRTLDHEIALRSGLVADLEDDGPRGAPAPALGVDAYRERWKARAREHDDFPSGYFATPDGTMMGVRIVTPGTGMGDRGGDALLTTVGAIVRELDPRRYGPAVNVGFAGDIPNAIAEKDSLVSDAAWATGIAFLLLLGGVVFFFRSPWCLAIIFLPALIGVGCAYSFAMRTYGYVNTSGAFLGAIILGNGINYPIVLLSRYREFRARGQAPDVARRGAVWNAFRAELVGALVGSIAYGSLVVTRFRGFSQFGLIGFVGMLLVWLSMIPCVPAMLVLMERLQARLPPALRDPPARIEGDGSRGRVTRILALATERRPWTFLVVATIVGVGAAARLPAYLQDPWEYDFDKLGSRGTKHGGAGEWSNKAERVFGGKMNVAGARMLADSPLQVPLLKRQILANDAKDPKGRLIADVATVADLMPGSPEEQARKLDVLRRIRERLTPAVLASLPVDERARVLELEPPERLAAVTPESLPALLRRRFAENDGTVGTVFYVKFRNDVSLSDGYNMLRIARSTDNVVLPDGTTVATASRSTIFAEMIRSMERDGPLATAASFAGVVLVVLVATGNLRGAFAVLAALVWGVLLTVGGAALGGSKLNFLNFIALPITFGIGCEYPFNIYDRARLLRGDVTSAVKRSGGAVALCSYTTIIGYSSLLFADNQALQSFGRLAMSGELACLCGALLVLPAILHVMGAGATMIEPSSATRPGGV